MIIFRTGISHYVEGTCIDLATPQLTWLFLKMLGINMIIHTGKMSGLFYLKIICSHQACMYLWTFMHNIYMYRYITLHDLELILKHNGPFQKIIWKWGVDGEFWFFTPQKTLLIPLRWKFSKIIPNYAKMKKFNHQKWQPTPFLRNLNSDIRLCIPYP